MSTLFCVFIKMIIASIIGFTFLFLFIYLKRRCKENERQKLINRYNRTEDEEWDVWHPDNEI